MIQGMKFDPYNEVPKLPIDQHEKSLLYLLDKHRVVIVVGETGCGKSTRIPEILFSAGIYNKRLDNNVFINQMIGITQPRRLAAVQLANRVAQSLNCNLGSTVGYTISFQDMTNVEETMIKFMTEGLLIRELMVDPLLTSYSAIVVDEVHERNLYTDILLGLLKCILIKRKDLRLIICSATLNIDDITKFFKYNDEILGQHEALNEVGLLYVGIRSYPAKIYYLKDPIPNYVEASITTVINIHESSRLASGKILVFLTGKEEVEYVCDKLADYAQTSSSRLDLKKLLILPFHASLKPEQVSRVFDEHGNNTRVCVVSTNIAETSLTIRDIAFVIDCGFVKLKIYDHKTGIDSLMRIPISKSSANQRAGRAWQTRKGSVYRLYTEDEYDRLEESTIPEIQRSSLQETVMLLKSLGVDNLQSFPLISPMPRDNLVVALELLYALQAIDDAGQLTSIGETMVGFNLDPKLSRILVSSNASNCSMDICKIAAMLQVKDIFVKPERYSSSLWSNTNLTNICVSEGDLPSYLNLFNSFLMSGKSKKWAEKRYLNYQALVNAVEISSKLESQANKFGIKRNSCNGRIAVLQKCIVTGLFSNAAYLHPCGDYKTIRGDQIVYIHPTSVFSEIIDRPKHVVFMEISYTTKAYMRHIMSVERDWLLKETPHQLG